MKPQKLDQFPAGMFRKYKKSLNIYARKLTRNDFVKLKGLIHTNEGPASFKPGDYLAKRLTWEVWPIPKNELKLYKKVKNDNRLGWASYQSLREVVALKIDKPFKVKTKSGDFIYGKPGDYLVRGDGNQWVVETTLFERSYKPLSRSDDNKLIEF